MSGDFLALRELTTTSFTSYHFILMMSAINASFVFILSLCNGEANLPEQSYI